MAPEPHQKLSEMNKELPKFDPSKFRPGQVPQTVEKGGHEYVIVVSGVADTGRIVVLPVIKRLHLAS